MNFDKTKAMRNAERYLAQGKIRSAIGEYKQVVGNDPKDFGTMNMLGDLYVKNAEKKEAVKCYTAVAEHYGNQGFAQKAIAVYNKITKLEPDNVEISEKLAELYKYKGSIREARSHYETLAEHYEKSGRKIEALAIWKQIAMLDPNNTEAYLTLAESYLNENEFDEAADAFLEAGNRFAKLGQHNLALDAISRSLGLKPAEPKALTAFVESSFAAGRNEKAIEKLDGLLEKDPHNREVLLILVDCHIAMGNTADAEKSVVRLVEQEPANYLKLLEVSRAYMKAGDVPSASRMLSMASEHLLLNGQADELGLLIGEILDKDPNHLETLRLLSRFTSWQHDEAAFRSSLERLSHVARDCDAVDDERYALSQLVMIMPQETGYAERLREINDLYGYGDSESADSLFDKRFLKVEPEPMVETFTDTEEGDAEIEYNADFAIVGESDVSPNGFAFVETAGSEMPDVEVAAAGSSSFATDSDRANKEIDSIKFYIDSGYLELAEKAIGELRSEFGDRREVSDLLNYLAAKESDRSGNEAVQPAELDSTLHTANGKENSAHGFDIQDLRSELGLEEPEPPNDGDYETHYHTAVAYQEMGLLEEAIKEFQEAISLVTPMDGTRRFFACANLLGHCFMQKGMPNLALTWYHRTLETPGLTDDEKQALWYELASAYEADGDHENAGRYFEQVYAENIDFRDVSARIRNITVNH